MGRVSNRNGRRRKLFHLPDLPNVGYATMREKAGSDAIMLFMRKVERDRLLLLTIVTKGIREWHANARDAFGHSLSITDDILNEIFWYFTLMAMKPRFQRALLDARGNTLKTRAIIRAAMPDIEMQLAAVKALQN